MEGGHILRKNPVNIAHLPTFMLAIGYPVYWVLMLTHQAPKGITSSVAWWLFVLFAAFVILRERRAIAETAVDMYRRFLALNFIEKGFFSAGSCIGLFILFCAFMASLLPPHLSQESDLMNYHQSLSRQHLILGSFEHIPWSANDFFYIPIDLALAPFWFVSALPNKFPQFIFSLGIIAVIISLARWFKAGAFTAAAVSVFAFLGSHGHGIQLGTGMLDLTVCYLFLASLDSLLRRQKWLLITEVTFFLWSKSLVVLQMGALVVLLVCVFRILRITGAGRVLFDFEKAISPEDLAQIMRFMRGCLGGILIVSLGVAGPFLFKSLYYTGTPFFPVAFGMLSYHPGIPEGSTAWESLGRSAGFLTDSIRQDGYGRSIVDFLAHFWAIAVPAEQVNNAFDYPMGLSYLLFLGPFMFFIVRSVRKKEFPVLPWLVVCYWILWWFSVRETRHLYAPVILMFIVSSLSLRNWSKVLFVVLILAMSLNAISVYRAHRSNFFKPPDQVLRADDRHLASLSRQYHDQGRSDVVELQEHEVAYALFPVVVRGEFLPHVVSF